jgi:hypothetical protein
MIGYKAFNRNWKCRGHQYRIGQTYQMSREEIEIGKSGFHFCRVPIDVLHYSANDDDKYAEICADDKIIERNEVCVSNKIKIIRELTKEDIYQLSSGLFIRSNGTLERYFKGLLHSINPPTIKKKNGDLEWYQFGLLHRVDGPAIEMSNGLKLWYNYGNLLHVDGHGPAIY